ncbi:unnamed protein product [Caenorhabditis angaria]|uniref:Uncharacterized protein n=1 Tax=Caenorhabditis angaria TaxID=860376 RepID=A0A9P1I588_9PELO|nr:unnamed protein product [Caenorhabditis angaria]
MKIPTSSTTTTLHKNQVNNNQYLSTQIKRICSPMLSLASTQWKSRHKQHEKQLYGEGNKTVRNIYEIFHS